MSHQEQESLVGGTLIQYQEKKKTLCCMETKAARIAENLEAVATLLRNIPEFQAPPRHNPNLVPEHSPHDEVFDLVCKIWDLRNEIAADRKALTGMGVCFPIE